MYKTVPRNWLRFDECLDRGMLQCVFDLQVASLKWWAIRCLFPSGVS